MFNAASTLLTIYSHLPPSPKHRCVATLFELRSSLLASLKLPSQSFDAVVAVAETSSEDAALDELRCDGFQTLTHMLLFGNLNDRFD